MAKQSRPKSPTVKPLPPLAEHVAQLLLGIEGVPVQEQGAMVRRAVIAVAKWENVALRGANDG